MFNVNLTQLLASFFRLVAMMSKFLLVFYLAKVLSLESFGIFSLFMVALQLSSSLIPFDIYSNSIRSILDGKSIEFSKHIGFLFLASIIFTPLTTLMFHLSIDSVYTYTAFFFFCICPLDVIFQDTLRFFPVFKKPFLGSLLLFIKTTMLTVVIFLFFEEGLVGKSLYSVLLIWFLVSFFSTSLVFFLLFYFKKISLKGLFSVDRQWITNSIRLSFIFLISTLLFRSILGVDKFIVESMLGLELVAVYSLYFSIAFASTSILESGISSWYYPKLVRVVRTKSKEEVKVFLKDYYIKNLLSSFSLISIVVFTFPYLVNFYLDDIYLEYIYVFYLICFGVFMYSSSVPFHYYIYALNKDKVFVIIYLIAFLSYILVGVFLINTFGFLGSGIMISFGLIMIAFLRYLYTFWSIRNSQNMILR